MRTTLRSRVREDAGAVHPGDRVPRIPSAATFPRLTAPRMRDSRVLTHAATAGTWISRGTTSKVSNRGERGGSSDVRKNVPARVGPPASRRVGITTFARTCLQTTQAYVAAFVRTRETVASVRELSKSPTRRSRVFAVLIARLGIAPAFLRTKLRGRFWRAALSQEDGYPNSSGLRRSRPPDTFLRTWLLAAGLRADDPALRSHERGYPTRRCTRDLAFASLETCATALALRGFIPSRDVLANVATSAAFAAPAAVQNIGAPTSESSPLPQHPTSNIQHPTSNIQHPTSTLNSIPNS
jgi:hypothetical protein